MLLSLGKLGGREMSYHSDLDLILVYEGDGRTLPPPRSSRFDTFELTDNFHFFSQLARQIIRMASQMGPMGRLYQVDMRLRPTGKSGSLVIPLGEFVLLRRWRRPTLGAAGPDPRPRRFRRRGVRPRGDGGGVPRHLQRAVAP